MCSWAKGAIDEAQGYRPEELMLRAKQLVDRLEYQKRMVEEALEHIKRESDANPYHR